MKYVTQYALYSYNSWSILSKVAFIWAISSSWDVIIFFESSFTSTSGMSACLLVKIADEW